jgi:hypothetical protein
MESNTQERSDAKQIVEIADLRTQLWTNLTAEFQPALCLATALTDEQRQSAKNSWTSFQQKRPASNRTSAEFLERVI